MIRWIFFPKNIDSPQLLKQIIEGFQQVDKDIDSEKHQLTSDQVLGILRPYLQELGF